MTNTDNLAELRNTVSDLSASEHLGDGGRLGNLVSDLNDLSSIRVSRSSDTKSIVRECSPIGSSGRLGERVVGDTAVPSAWYVDEVAGVRTLAERSNNLHFRPIHDGSGKHLLAFRS